LRAGLDELSSQSEDGTGTELGVEGSRDRVGTRRSTDEGLMAGLDGRNAGSSAEDSGVLDKGSSANVAIEPVSFWVLALN